MTFQIHPSEKISDRRFAILEDNVKTLSLQLNSLLEKVNDSKIVRNKNFNFKKESLLKFHYHLRTILNLPSARKLI